MDDAEGSPWSRYLSHWHPRPITTITCTPIVTKALKYAQITQREIEYVAISRDTTEGDLKQRREIINGTAVFVDQACVRAAIHGRILILDGVEVQQIFMTESREKYPAYIEQSSRKQRDDPRRWAFSHLS